MNENISAEILREVGMINFFRHNGDMEKRSAGLRMLVRAQEQGDPEAMYIVSRLILDSALTPTNCDPEDYALSLMCKSANKGYIQARAYLNAYCEERYQEEYDDLPTNDFGGALVDFDGKPIKINRKGVFTPIDAVLEYKDGRNVLTISTNLMFLYGEEVGDPESFEQAVYNGLLAWQGEYEVFGGQKLSVRVDVTSEDNLFDNIMILPITGEIGSVIQTVSNVIGTKDRKEQIVDMIANKRSFAAAGIKWSVNSRKIICIQSESGRFDDYDEIMHVTKHEFGHALGLGDLYFSPVDSLDGIERGTYAELDSYAIYDKFYNLVMCDHHGPVSNNDIEMVVLAFRENKMQLYQPRKFKGKVSSALGKGN